MTALTVSTVPPVQPNHMLVVTMSDDDRKALHTHPTFGPFAAYWSVDSTVYLRAGKVGWLYPLACSVDWPWEFLAAGSAVPGSLEVQPSVSAELLQYRLDARDLWDARYRRRLDSAHEDSILARMDDAWRKCTPDERTTADTWLLRDEFVWLRWAQSDAYARGDSERTAALGGSAVAATRSRPDLEDLDEALYAMWPWVPQPRAAWLHDMLTRHLLEP